MPSLSAQRRLVAAGWYHIQINLAKLTAPSDADAKSAIASLANLWTRIIILDKSGGCSNVSSTEALAL